MDQLAGSMLLLFTDHRWSFMGFCFKDSSLDLISWGLRLAYEEAFVLLLLWFPGRAPWLSFPGILLVKRGFAMISCFLE